MFFLTFLLCTAQEWDPNCPYREEWSTCGGGSYAGETCCPEDPYTKKQTYCYEQNQWHHACRYECPQGWVCENPTARPTQPPSYPPTDCTNQEHGQCGGRFSQDVAWTEANGFETCCPPGTACFALDAEWYHQCLMACPADDSSAACHGDEAPVEPSSSSEEPSSEDPVEPSSSSEEPSSEDPPSSEEDPVVPGEDSYPSPDLPTGSHCMAVDYTWSRTSGEDGGSAFTGFLSFTQPRRGKSLFVLEGTKVTWTSATVQWDDAPLDDRHAQPPLDGGAAYALWPTHPYHHSEHVSMNMGIVGAEPGSAASIVLHHCLYPVERDLQLDATDLNSLKKSVVSLVSLLSQSMWESGGGVPWQACDENNRAFRNDASCGMNGDYTVDQSYAGRDAEAQSRGVAQQSFQACPVSYDYGPDFASSATSTKYWTWFDECIGGVPSSASCAEGINEFDCGCPLRCNHDAETAGCCWWGRGMIQLTGPANYRKMQNVLDYIPGYEQVDVCVNPAAVCEDSSLTTLAGLVYWQNNVVSHPCYDAVLEAYVEVFDLSAEATAENGMSCPPVVEAFSLAVYGGNMTPDDFDWRTDPINELENRRALFLDLMAVVQPELESYVMGQEPPADLFECSGDVAIDSVFHLADLKGATGIEDSRLAGYSWERFCGWLRMYMPEEAES